jgi:hypothetical protein
MITIDPSLLTRPQLFNPAGEEIGKWQDGKPRLFATESRPQEGDPLVVELRVHDGTFAPPRL